MPNDKIAIQLPDNDSFTGYFAAAKSGHGPGLILIQEIFGVNASIRAIADRYAAAGYSVLAPDLFFRLKANVELGYQGKDLEEAFEDYHRFDVKQGVADLSAAITTLKNRKECSGKIGVMGFCLGGKMAYLTASAYPVDACVAFYGGGIVDHLDVAKKIKCPVLMHFGGQDEMIPEEQVERIKEAFEGRHDVEIFVYPHADHAFYNHDRSNYNPVAAKLAEDRTLQFLQRSL